MNAVASYLRHVIVGLVVLAAERIGLPAEGLGVAAEELAVLLVGTLTWLAVKYGPAWLKGGRAGMILLLAALTMCLNSCAALSSAFTGRPIPTTPVMREGGRPIQVATEDILRAEMAPPETAWGLYDAGAAAARARVVIDAGK